MRFRMDSFFFEKKFGMEGNSRAWLYRLIVKSTNNQIHQETFLSLSHE